MRYYLFLLLIFTSGCEPLNPLKNLDRHPRENAHTFFIKNECSKELVFFATNITNGDILYQTKVVTGEESFFWIGKNIADYKEIQLTTSEPKSTTTINITANKNRYFGSIVCLN